MHTVIAAEALFFVLAFAKGAGIMLGYDILRAFRRGFPHGGRLVAAEDFFYWDAFLYFAVQSEDPSRIFDFFRLSFPHDCRSFPADFDACRKIGQKIEKNGQESIEKEDKTG